MTMTTYKILRTYMNTKVATVEASSREEAIDKAIKENCWQDMNTNLISEYIISETTLDLK